MSSFIRTRIAGFNHHKGAAEALMPMKAETRLLLVEEPTNPHDKNAVAIVTATGLMLGYVPAVDAPNVKTKMNDKDILVRCYKTAETFNSVRIEFLSGDPFE